MGEFEDKEEPTYEERDPNAPKWLHITKAGTKKAGVPTSFDDEDGYTVGYLGSAHSNPLWNPAPRSNTPTYSTGLFPSEIKQLKKYRIPVHYMITCFVHIMAKSLDEAIQKGMGVEAPHIDVYDTSAHDPTIESEVAASEAEEIED